MSSAAAVEATVPAKGGKKKLLIIVVAAVLLLGAAGGGFVYWMKAKAHAAQLAEEDADEADDAHADAKHGAAAAKRDPKVAPVFITLDPFTVNLADREADRYAQIAISLELNDPKAAEKIKVFMPAIRNNILMVMAHKRSSDLLERAGKEKLAEEVLVETERALGIEPPTPGARKKKAAEEEPRPIRAVHFSNFIIQ